VYRQYDHQVQTNTVQAPGGDAAVLRIKGTRKGIALATDGNGRYCYLDPYVGGMIAVAEACRNVSCTGAEPIALTDCLNFGNPEKPEIYYQLENCIKGMAEASRAFGAPVISGNVSLYNESHGEGIYPTPVIGALGLLQDVSRNCRAAFAHEGDAVVYLGASSIAGDARHLAASEYLERLHGIVAGQPQIDIQREVAVQKAVRELIARSALTSAHDCSDGGLLVAIAESCMLGGIGFQGSLALTGRWDAVLFGEAQSRIVVSLPESTISVLKNVCDSLGVPYLKLGEVRGERITVDGLLDEPLSRLADVWDNALERSLRGSSH
jgi:phosphoribosylformylglycinamidine synthase